MPGGLTSGHPHGFGMNRMVRVSQFMAVLLLALWLPATQHCALEAVGALATTCADHCTTGESTGKDACGSLEDGSYKPSTVTSKVTAPSLFACACFLSLHLELCATDESQALPGEAFGQAKAWISSWQFVRRAAPLPGAPSLLLA